MRTRTATAITKTKHRAVLKAYHLLVVTEKSEFTVGYTTAEK
ncbi:MAG: hypothetical protein ABIJ00_02055 [Candidatus Eisenbacteria bacterium]